MSESMMGLVAIFAALSVWRLWQLEFRNAELKRQLEQMKASRDDHVKALKMMSVMTKYNCFCELCGTQAIFDNADHARNNGWEIENGQQFCPEHRG